MDQHVEEEHLEDKEALLIEPSEDSGIALGFLHVSIASLATQVSDREPPQQAPQHDAQVCRGVEDQVQDMREDCFRAKDETAHADAWGEAV